MAMERLVEVATSALQRAQAARQYEEQEEMPADHFVAGIVQLV